MRNSTDAHLDELARRFAKTKPTGQLEGQRPAAEPTEEFPRPQHTQGSLTLWIAVSAVGLIVLAAAVMLVVARH